MRELHGNSLTERGQRSNWVATVNRRESVGERCSPTGSDLTRSSFVATEPIERTPGAGATGVDRRAPPRFEPERMALAGGLEAGLQLFLQETGQEYGRVQGGSRRKDVLPLRRRGHVRVTRFLAKDDRHEQPSSEGSTKGTPGT